jgi:hypothetical protein
VAYEVSFSDKIKSVKSLQNMRKAKDDPSLPEKTRKEIINKRLVKESMPLVWGASSTRNYENAQLLIRYPIFISLYKRLERNNELNDATLLRLLTSCEVPELLEDIKEFNYGKGLHPYPRSKVLEVLEEGSNSLEAWMHIYLTGIPDRMINFPLSEFLGYSLNLTDEDPLAEQLLEAPYDFPKSMFSFNYLGSKNTLEFFIRLKREDRYPEQICRLSEIILSIAGDYFEPYKPVPDLDRKLIILREVEEAYARTREVAEFTPTEEEEPVNFRKIDVFYELYNEGAETDEDEDEEMKRRNSSYRKIKSEISKIQKERFVKKE